MKISNIEQEYFKCNSVDINPLPFLILPSKQGKYDGRPLAR